MSLYAINSDMEPAIPKKDRATTARAWLARAKREGKITGFTVKSVRMLNPYTARPSKGWYVVVNDGNQVIGKEHPNAFCAAKLCMLAIGKHFNVQEKAA